MHNQLNSLVKGLAKQAVLTSAGMDSASATEMVFSTSGHPLSSTYKLQLQLMRDSLEMSMNILLNGMTTDVADKVITSLQTTSFNSRRIAPTTMVVIGIVKHNGEWALEMTDTVVAAYNETLTLDQMTIEEMILVMEHIERSL